MLIYPLFFHHSVILPTSLTTSTSSQLLELQCGLELERVIINCNIGALAKRSAPECGLERKLAETSEKGSLSVLV